MVDLNKRSLLIATGSLVGVGSVGYEFLGEDESGSGSGGSAETGPETSSKITILGYEDGAMEVSVENTGDTVLDDTLEVVSDAGVERSREYQLKPGTTTFMSLDMTEWSSYSGIVVRDSRDSANADFTPDLNMSINQDPITEEIEISIENADYITVDDTLTVTADTGQEEEIPYSIKSQNTKIFTVDITGWNINGTKSVEITNVSNQKNINLPKVNLLKQPDLDTARDNWDPTNGNSEYRIVKYYTKGGTVLEAPLDIDAFAVGGGGGGEWALAGGGGGYTTTEAGIQGIFDVTIGSGGGIGEGGGATEIKNTNGDVVVRADGGQEEQGLDGGDGGSGGGACRGGDGGSDGSGGSNDINGDEGRGGSGQGSTTRAFAESGWELYAGGGGGGGPTSGDGGSGGGGGSGSGNDGTDGLGGGGHGNGGGKGGDGAVLFRWPQHIGVIDES